MSYKNTSKSFKDNHKQSSQRKTNFSSDDPRVRVLQYNLVFVNGVPSEIACLDLLKDELHFGRYGKVSKSILNPSYPYKKGVNYQAYATYESQLDAALAIVALHGITLYERPLKVSYGTIKYCNYFLKGRQCTNDDCFYLHEIRKQNQVVNGDPKSIFRDQNLRAIRIVINNIQKVIERMIDSQTEDIEEGFPSLTETIDYLIDNDYLNEQKYYQVEAEIKNRRVQENQVNQNLPLEDVQNPLNISEKQNVEQPPKLLKSNSFSTMTSPNKPEILTQFDDEDKIVSEIDVRQKANSSDKIGQNQLFEDRTVCSDNEKNKNYQSSLDFDDKSEQMISQKIIKQIMKKKGLKSRFDFVNIDFKNNETIDEIKRVKNIIQRYLITFQ